MSDIYLKVKLEPAYVDVLEANFAKDDRPPSFELPDDLKLPGWDLPESGLVYYQHGTGDVNEGGFITNLAFQEDSGFLYCRIMEYAP